MEVELVVEVVEVAVFVADEVVVVGELDVLPDEASVFPTMLVLLMMAQTEFPAPSVTQLYPNGQHLVPHVGKLSSNLVVKIPAVGFDVAFCDATLHEIVWILLHELDSGQQRADEEVSRETQLLPVGQVKLLGNFGSTAEQELSSLRNIPGNRGGNVLSKADVVEMIAVAIRTVATVQGLEICMLEWDVQGMIPVKRANKQANGYMPEVFVAKGHRI